MSGHSKWATIKRKKAANDAKRGKLFGKLIRAVEIAARSGGGDPAGNPTLAAAIAKAKSNGVPSDNIDRAIKRATGDVGGADFEEIWYEGYGPGGVAIYVEAVTDNRNRAASDIRATFTRNGGSLGEPGSVSYLFEQKAQIPATGEEDAIMMAALDAGADDVVATGDGFEIVGPPGALARIQEAIEEVGATVEAAEVTQLPVTTVVVDEGSIGRVLRLIEALDDLDDVQAVYSNFDADDEVLAAAAAE